MQHGCGFPDQLLEGQKQILEAFQNMYKTVLVTSVVIVASFGYRT